MPEGRLHVRGTRPSVEQDRREGVPEIVHPQVGLADRTTWCDLDTIEALPLTEAAQLIRDHAALEQARREAVERAMAERKYAPRGALRRMLSKASTGSHPRTSAPRHG